MTRYTDAALLTGEYAHMAAQLRAGDRTAPGPAEWEKTACDNQAEEAAQDVAKHIFAFQQSLDPETEQLEVFTYSAAGQIKVLAVVPGEGDLLRIDGLLMPAAKPASVIIHAALLSLTLTRVPLAKDETQDEGLKIGFVIFDELKERQKARYKSKKKKLHVDLTQPFGLPNTAAGKKPARRKSGSKKTGKTKGSTKP
ncbi:hypothetical protein [Salaquimonas pukyongi]|uniref:hypothetical protein n=1 Tax=Salaquimonas pukyongi TaxID=2712698 RepID=UPI00096B9364|nr:hypothetical protein [Salaquimonas pukyongi]